MKTSAEGIALIKKFEGLELDSYQCSATVWTLGYGHTQGVAEGDSCSEEEAEIILGNDLKEFETYVNALVDVELDQNQFVREWESPRPVAAAVKEDLQMDHHIRDGNH